MKLCPTEPPGHARRKLRGLVSEIQRLRAEGYTIGAIRQALLDAGIEVGWSTVQRETARLAQAPAEGGRSPGKASAAPPSPAHAGQAGAAPSSSGPAADVDSFFDQHVTNPLFRKKGRQA